MRKKIILTTLVLVVLSVIIFFLINHHNIRPIDGVMLTDRQKEAQKIALGESEVLKLLGWQRAEVMHIAPAGQQLPENAQLCQTKTCFLVQIYNFEKNATVAALVEPEGKTFVTALEQPHTQPPVNDRMVNLALHMIINQPEVKQALGYQPQKVDMLPVNSTLAGTECADKGHLCVAATIENGEEDLWAVVDLTLEKFAGLHKTPLSPEKLVVVTPAPKSNTCPPPVRTTQGKWVVNYEISDANGLRIFDVTYSDKAILKSVTMLGWNVDYGGSGFVDANGCGALVSGRVIAPYGGSATILPLSIQEQTGFEIVQDFRMANWGENCNYRYEQRYQFLDNGDFRFLVGAFGRGCGTNAIYRPILRIDIAAGQDEHNQFYFQKNGDWQAAGTEDWWKQNTDGVTNWRLQGTNVYNILPNTGEWQANGRPDDGYLYVSLHHPAEGDVSLNPGQCCSGDEQQFPYHFIDGESIANQNLVLWYTPQLKTDITPGSQYCWTEQGYPDPIAYPCYGGIWFLQP